MPAREKKGKSHRPCIPSRRGCLPRPLVLLLLPPCAAVPLGRNRESDDDERDLGDLSLRPATCLPLPPPLCSSLSTSSSHLSATVTGVLAGYSFDITLPTGPLAFSNPFFYSGEQATTSSTSPRLHRVDPGRPSSNPFHLFPPHPFLTSRPPLTSHSPVDLDQGSNISDLKLQVGDRKRAEIVIIGLEYNSLERVAQ